MMSAFLKDDCSKNAAVGTGPCAQSGLPPARPQPLSAEHLLAPDHIDAAARPSGRIDGKQAHVEIVRLKSASRFDFLTPDGQH
jgi:hypothetical protein